MEQVFPPMDDLRNSSTPYSTNRFRTQRYPRFLEWETVAPDCEAIPENRLAEATPVASEEQDPGFQKVTVAVALPPQLPKKEITTELLTILLHDETGNTLLVSSAFLGLYIETVLGVTNQSRNYTNALI